MNERETADTIHVLHIEDDPDLSNLVATFLEREDDRFNVQTTISPTDGLKILTNHEIDCIISDHDMPGMTGIEFLETVREAHPDLPFILYTGKGSEEVASEAISKGVTDYLQKETGTSQYTVLRNRIENAVSQFRTQQELELQQAESAQLLDWLDHALTATDTYVWEWDLKTDEIQRHPTTEPVFGIKSDAIGGVHEGWIDHVHSDDRPAVEETISEGIESGEGYHVTCRVETEDGSWRWVRDRAEVETEGGELLRAVGSVTDVTNQIEREQQYQLLTEEANDVILVVDSDGSIDYVSDAAVRVLGYEPDTLVGEDGFDHIHPADRGHAVEQFGEMVKNPEYRPSVEYRFKRPDGSWVWLESRGRNLVDEPAIEGIVIYSRDITDRKEREQKLERYETIVETAGDPMYMLDAQGHIDYVNETFVELSGYSEAALLNEHVGKLMDEGDLEQAEELIRSLVTNRQRQGTFEIEAITADGDRIPAENHITLLYDDGEFNGSVGVMRVIAERVAQRRRLQRERNRLDDFAEVVSHDLRNPLNVAQGRLDLAVTECDSEHLDAVERAHRRMDQLIDDMVSLARAGQAVNERNAVDLTARIDACWRNVETGSARIVTETADVVQADESRLQQLFENLFRNAVEHASEDVRLTVGKLDDGFYVEDDGPGIPPDERDDVFDAGYSTSDEGTGFGLSIVKEVVDAHDWEIRITEGSEGGARFEITDVDLAG